MTRSRRTSGDHGLAAVELGLLLTVLLAMVALVAPIAFLFFERVQLDRTGGDAIRFASSRSDQARTVASFTVPAKELPGAAAVQAEQRRAYRGRGTLAPGTPQRTTDAVCPSGRRVTITLTATVDVGPFAGLILSGGTRTLETTVTSCEE